MELEVICKLPSGDSNRIPLLFVHGGFHAAWCWEEFFLPYFAQKGYASYAVSLRGHGGSFGHESIRTWRLDDYVEDVKNVFDRLDNPPILIGHSLGCSVIQKLLIKTDAPAAVLLAPTPVRSIVGKQLMHLFRYPAPFIKTLLMRDMIHLLPTFKRVFFSKDMDKEIVDRFFSKMCNESFELCIRAASSLRLDSVSVNVPVYIAGGSKDSSVPARYHMELAKAYSTTAEFFPVSHDMMLDPQWELVADRIFQWLIQTLSSE